MENVKTNFFSIQHEQDEYENWLTANLDDIFEDTHQFLNGTLDAYFDIFRDESQDNVYLYRLRACFDFRNLDEYNCLPEATFPLINPAKIDDFSDKLTNYEFSFEYEICFDKDFKIIHNWSNSEYTSHIDAEIEMIIEDQFEKISFLVFEKLKNEQIRDTFFV